MKKLILIFFLISNTAFASSITVFPDPNIGTTSVDGRVNRVHTGDTWSQIRDGAGNGSVYQNDTQDRNVEIICDAGGTTYFAIQREIMLYDTSAIGAGQTVSAATLGIVSPGKIDSGSNSPTSAIYASNPASNTALVNADYQTMGQVKFSDDITYASWNTDDATYNTHTFNASGLAAISLTGISKFANLESTYDGANNPMTCGTGTAGFSSETADAAGTSLDPKLIVTYAPTPIASYLMQPIITNGDD